MKEPRISAIAAIGENRELGKDNQLIWKLEADFARMKELIKGHVLVMGRSTYESIGRELPCPSVVITTDQQYQSPYNKVRHTFIVHSLAEAMEKAEEIESAQKNTDPEIFIFGGAKVYTDALPQTSRLYLTKIAATNEVADTFFPDYSEFTKVLEKIPAQENGIDLTFLTLER